MARWKAHSFAALVAATAAPLAASAQPAENNDFEWRDFDLSGDIDPSNPYYAQPRLVAPDIDWSVFGSGSRPALAFNGVPMKPDAPKGPTPKPSLGNAAIDWSLYGVSTEDAPAPPDQPRTLTSQVVRAAPEPAEPAADPALTKDDINWSVFGESGDRVSLDLDGEPMTPNPPKPDPTLVKAHIDWSVYD